MENEEKLVRMMILAKLSPVLFVLLIVSIGIVKGCVSDEPDIERQNARQESIKDVYINDASYEVSVSGTAQPGRLRKQNGETFWLQTPSGNLRNKCKRMPWLNLAICSILIYTSSPSSPSVTVIRTSPSNTYSCQVRERRNYISAPIPK